MAGNAGIINPFSFKDATLFVGDTRIDAVQNINIQYSTEIIDVYNHSGGKYAVIPTTEDISLSMELVFESWIAIMEEYGVERGRFRMNQFPAARISVYRQHIETSQYHSQILSGCRLSSCSDDLSHAAGNANISLQWMPREVQFDRSDDLPTALIV